MPERSSKPEKQPRDFSQLAKAIVDEATAEETDVQAEDEIPADDGKNPAAVALGRLGGLKGGKARAKSLTKEQRSEIARKAGVNRTKVYRMPKFLKAYEFHHDAQIQSRLEAKPHGEIDPETGVIEVSEK